MVEGSASLMTMMYAALASGAWTEERGRNRTDGGAHYYHVYETRDGEHVAIGQPAPAPRFLGTPPHVQHPPARIGEHTDAILKDWGFATDEIAALHDGGAVRSAM